MNKHMVQKDQLRDLSLILTGAALVNPDAVVGVAFIPTSEFADLWKSIETKNGQSVWHWFERYSIKHEEGMTALAGIQNRLELSQRMDDAQKAAERMKMAISIGNAEEFERNLEELRGL